MDKLTKEKRSWNMSRIKGRDTKPELKVRSYLHKQGFRFRLHKKGLPGCPDIVLPKYRTVILVHGCFWHRHTKCKLAYEPKTRIEYWNDKFAENVLRDRRVVVNLKDQGWFVSVVWECQTRKDKLFDQVMEKLVHNLRNQ